MYIFAIFLSVSNLPNVFSTFSSAHLLDRINWGIAADTFCKRLQRKLCTAISTVKTLCLFWSYSIYTFLFLTKYVFSKKKKKIIISPPFYKKYLWLFTKQHYVNARRFRGILRELDGLTSMDLILLFYFFSEISKTINTRHRNNNDTSPYLLVH